MYLKRYPYADTMYMYMIDIDIQGSVECEEFQRLRYGDVRQVAMIMDAILLFIWCYM